MTENELNEKMNVLGSLMKEFNSQKAEFENSTKTLVDDIENLKSELKAEFINLKESRETDGLIVKYRKGSVRWNSELLNVYSKTHPEMKAFQKIGEPTVAFYLPKITEMEEMECL